jgi:PAS domain S-box-containing protein
MAERKKRSGKALQKREKKEAGVKGAARRKMSFEIKPRRSLTQLEQQIARLRMENERLQSDCARRNLAWDVLRESRQRFQKLVETLYDWIWEVDAKGHYTYVSPQIKNILGYEKYEVLGKTPYDLMPPEEAESISKKINALMAERKPITAFENVNLHKNGRRVILETNGLPFFDVAGNFRGYRGTDRDITERKQAERALREAAEEREKLIHDLQFALDNVKTLQGLIPICASCKKMRDDKGYWNQVEEYITEHTDASFTHGLCPDCAKKMYDEIYEQKKTSKSNP